MRYLLCLALAGCGWLPFGNGGNGGTDPATLDYDGDGIVASQDCNDSDAASNPGAVDFVGDGVDQNCDGVDGVDADGDGVPGVGSGGMDCNDNDPTSMGFDGDGDGSLNCMDCDDNNAAVNPQAQEVCDGVDNNCDQVVDVAGGVGTCTVEFQAAGSVDVLWVVDNSCSMGEEQAALTSNFPLFMDYFLGSGLDYHIGVVSTDMDDPNHNGRLRNVSGYKWIDEQTVSPETVFSDMASMGTNGSADEVGRDAAYMAVEVLTQPGLYNEGFIREEASLHILAVSDEDDHSTMISDSEFMDYLLTLKPSEDLVTFSSIIGFPGGSCTVEPGYGYLDITYGVGGILWDICSSDWSGVLDQLGLDLIGTTGRTLFLFEEAVEPTTLTATITDSYGATTEVPNSAITWNAADLTAELDYAYAVFPGSSILFRYAPDVGGGPTTTSTSPTGSTGTGSTGTGSTTSGTP